MIKIFGGKLKNGIITTLLAITMVFCTVLTANAGGGGGTGGGGGGGTTPVTFTGAYLSTVVNNSSTTGNSVIDNTKVPVKPTIKLVFSNNVVNEAVWSINQPCVTMKDSENNSVEIQVDRISDLVNDGEKQNIFVTPVDDLTLGKTYTLTISDSLKAKNLTTLGQIQNISFTVKTEITPPSLVISSIENNLKTNKSSVKISGTTEVGSTVKVNGALVTPDSIGAFTTNVKLKSGNNTITINSTDASDNTNTLVYKVNYDNLPPSLKISGPKNNSKTKKKTITITGTAEKGSIVKLNGKVITNQNGKFTKVISLKKGSNIIKIAATDSVGNTKTVTVKVIKS